MTTVTYRDGTMAADRATRYGSLAAHEVTKIVRRDDGALCGTAGCTSLAAGFRRWFLAGEDAATKPSLGDEKEDIHALIVRPDGSVEMYDRLGWAAIDGNFHAIGSGAECALGAMAMGASADRAVLIAAQFGIGVGQIVDVVEINPSGWPERTYIPPAPTQPLTPDTPERGEVEIPEGFKKWEGGERPVGSDDLVEVVLRNGTLNKPRAAYGYRWEHADWRSDSDIVGYRAYRIIDENPAPLNDQDQSSAPQSNLEESGEGEVVALPTVEAILGGPAKFVSCSDVVCSEASDAIIVRLYRNGMDGGFGGETNDPPIHIGKDQIGYYLIGHMYDFRQRGVNDFEAGVAFADCPFTAGSLACEKWREGWSSSAPNAEAPTPKPTETNDEGEDSVGGMTLVAEFDQDITDLTVVDGKLQATLADGSVVDVTQDLRDAAVDHVHAQPSQPWPVSEPNVDRSALVERATLHSDAAVFAEGISRDAQKKEEPKPGIFGLFGIRKIEEAN